MSGDTLGQLLLAAAALIVLTIAATVETMTGLISRQRLRQIADEESESRSVRALLDPRRSLAASLLLVQVLAVVVATNLLTTALQEEMGTFGRALTLLVAVLGFLLLGQAVPRALARYRPDRSLGFLVWLAGAFDLLVRPLILVVEGVANLLARLLPAPAQPFPPSGSEEELRTITLPDQDDGIIEADEREMIDGVLHLEEVTVREIMVPRVDIVAVERSVSPADLIETIVGAGHSRLPVYQESIDQILGVLYAKDLLPFVMGPTEALPLASLIRPPYVVPESKRIDDLLKELQRAKVHIAIVADEYGGTAGLVTIEDILEEIVGEIQDEYDVETPLFELVGPSELLADGRLALEDVEDSLEVTFDPDADYDTLGGFVQTHLGRLPREGDRFAAEGVEVEILSVERHRVRRLRVTKLQPAVAEREGGVALEPREVPASGSDGDIDGS